MTTEKTELTPQEQQAARKARRQFQKQMTTRIKHMEQGLHRVLGNVLRRSIPELLVHADHGRSMRVEIIVLNPDGTVFQAEPWLAKDPVLKRHLEACALTLQDAVDEQVQMLGRWMAEWIRRESGEMPDAPAEQPQIVGLDGEPLEQTERRLTLLEP